VHSSLIWLLITEFRGPYQVPSGREEGTEDSDLVVGLLPPPPLLLPYCKRRNTLESGLIVCKRVGSQSCCRGVHFGIILPSPVRATSVAHSTYSLMWQLNIWLQTQITKRMRSLIHEVPQFRRCCVFSSDENTPAYISQFRRCCVFSSDENTPAYISQFRIRSRDSRDRHSFRLPFALA
jgi:hypothetical protein